MNQTLALAVMESGENVLLSGPPGSGKTYVLNQFVRRAKKSGNHIAVTATTGLAATHLSGMTIHAWSGIGIADKLPNNYLSNLPADKRDIICKTDILIIDEISMMHDYQLDMVDTAIRKVRKNDVPFGGIQIILCGDFFQLPPIKKDKNSTNLFVVDSKVWHSLNLVICYLNEQHRQKDNSYLEILNAIRSNDLRRRHAESLLSRLQPNNISGEVTQLHTTRIDVDAINKQYLDRLKSKAHYYRAVTEGIHKHVEFLKRSCLASPELLLKKGALVMCVRNDPKKLYINGSLGIITGFEKSTGFPKVRLKNGRHIVASPVLWELLEGEDTLASLSQVPLQLAWAITIHKSQGLTIDAAYIDLRRAFIEGMGYVALSRLRSLESLSLAGLNKIALRVSPEALSIEQRLRAQSQLDDKRFLYLLDQENKNNGHETITSIGNLTHTSSRYPNAYKPWSNKDDTRLAGLFTSSKNINIRVIADMFGRQPGSIRSRIRKHLAKLRED
jgi:ATP-dependent DNA helicase PIF1